MMTLIQSLELKEVPDASIILNILPLDERELINQYFADEVTNSFSDREVMIAAMLVILFLILLIILIILLTKRISFYESLESEKKFDSAVIFWKGMLKEKLPFPPSSEKEFAGWYSEEGELVTEETEIRHSMKFYARWKD